jgi:RNA polymerase sigma factor (sigma-70 family)
MEQKQVDINENISAALKKYSDMVRRICFLYLQNSTDVDDVFQEVFLKLLQNKTPFRSEEHEKAWLIRATINKCKDLLKSFWRRNTDSIEYIDLPFEDKTEGELLQVVLSLPRKYKDVIYLHYYEEYTVPEMAKLLNQKENTIYSHLHRARALIKKKLGGKEYDYTF